MIGSAEKYDKTIKVAEEMPSCTLMNMCMVYDDAGRVLIQDKIHSRWPGITFPGGHVDEAESIYDSVVREVKEETGLTVSALEPVGMIHMNDPKAQTRRIIFLYKTSRFEGKLVDETHEGKVYWVSAQELMGMNLAPNVREYLRVFLNHDVIEAYITPDADGKNIFTFLPKK